MSFDWQTEDRHWDEQQEPPRRRAGRWTMDWAEAEDAAAAAKAAASAKTPEEAARAH